MDLMSLATNTKKILFEQKEIFTSAALLSAVLLAFFYGMFLIPLADFGFMRMSPVAITDILYIAIISVLAGGLVALYKHQLSQTNFDKRAVFGGAVASFGAAMCPACQGINLIAAGSTIASLPTAFLISFLPAIQLVGVALLGFAFYSTSNSIYTGVCIPTDKKIFLKSSTPKLSEPAEPNELASYFGKNKWAISAFVAVAALVFFNQVYATMVFSSLAGGPTGGVVLKSGPNQLEYGPKMTLKPMPLGAGEQPVISGYGSKVKPIPTISELQMSPSSGDLKEDLKNNVVPHGTPFYGTEAGVSFDDPVAAQKKWKTYINGIQLDAPAQQRWSRIVNSFTCDYCCGSPQQPTIITRCGCAHSYAAQGMAKWFLKNYGDKYSDEEIYGEMARWYAVWYPGPTIKRIIKEASV